MYGVMIEMNTYEENIKPILDLLKQPNLKPDSVFRVEILLKSIVKLFLFLTHNYSNQRNELIGILETIKHELLIH